MGDVGVEPGLVPSSSSGRTLAFRAVFTDTETICLREPVGSTSILHRLAFSGPREKTRCGASVEASFCPAIREPIADSPARDHRCGATIERPASNNKSTTRPRHEVAAVEDVGLGRQDRQNATSRRRGGRRRRLRHDRRQRDAAPARVSLDDPARSPKKAPMCSRTTLR